MKIQRHLAACMAAALALAASCAKEQTLSFGGPDAIMFSDTLYVFGIESAQEYFEIPVCASVAADHDRNVGVEILVRESDAVYGHQFELESHTVTIPAGQTTACVRVKGNPANIGINRHVSFTLNLVIPEENVWDLYGTAARVELRRCCPYSRDSFTGYMVVASSYAISYLPDYRRLTRAEADPDDPDGLIIKDFLYDGYDIRIKLDPQDRLNPTISYEEQVFAGTDVAFGTKYGDGNILMTPPSGYLSYYSCCENFLAIYMTLYVAGVGTVGTFANVCEMISDDEAERIMKEGL